MEAIKYNDLSPSEICLLIEGLRAIDADGLRNTKSEQSFIFRNIDSKHLVEVARLLEVRKTERLKGTFVGVLSGVDSPVEGR